MSFFFEVSIYYLFFICSAALCWETFNSLLFIRSFVKYFIEHSKEEDLFVHFGGFTLAQATKLQRGVHIKFWNCVVCKNSLQ